MEQISPTVHRRFILGKQGLWPGRRWSGREGVASALRAVEALQIDPVSVVAQSHDIALWGRVEGYRPEDFHRLAYEERRFFDYGGHLDLYPMDNLPYWRPLMERRRAEERWVKFAAEKGALVEEVRGIVSERGPVRSRELAGKKVDHYRAGKDTGVALYYLWLIGELMTHGREGRERVYDLTDRIAPAEYRHAVSEEEAVDFFVRKGISQRGMLDGREFRGLLRELTEPRAGDGEIADRLAGLCEAGELATLRVDGGRTDYYLNRSDLALLEELAADRVPQEWSVHGPTTEEEVVFLSPLEYVSARGRAKKLFEFEYTWEIYRPDHLRRYGPYTLPVLYGDRLVARIDMRLDRQQDRLSLNGIWIEQWFDADAPFAEAFRRGLQRFAAFLSAAAFDGIDSLDGMPKALTAQLRRLPR